VLKNSGCWDKSLPCAEFAYNNSYQSSIKMEPFEALYGTRLVRVNFLDQTVREAERHVEIIRENLKAAQSRQKSYADPRSREVVL
jgi:hypothetical protein